MSHSAKNWLWLVPYFFFFFLHTLCHVLRRYQCWAGCCWGNWGTATSIWHLGEHSQCGEQDGQHWSTRKDTGIKCYFPKSYLPESVIIKINHISKTLKTQTTKNALCHLEWLPGDNHSIDSGCLCDHVPIWPLTLEDTLTFDFWNVMWWPHLCTA